MHELLAVNERYHELMEEHARQSRALDANRGEAERLRAALANSEARVASLSAEHGSTLAAVRELRAANALQERRVGAAGDSTAQLSRQAQDATQRVLQLQVIKREWRAGNGLG